MEFKEWVKKLLPRQTTFSAVDYGTHSIRVATVSCAGPEPELLYLSRVVLPAVPEGSTLEEVQGRALAEAVEAAGLKGQQVFASLSSDKVIIRHVRVPYMPEKELISAVNYEAEKSIPIPLSDLIVRYVRLGESNDSEGRQINLLLVAVPLNEVHSYYELFAQAGITISALDLQPLALWRALAGVNASGKSPSGVTAIVDIGEINTILLVVQDGLLLFCRTLQVGGELLTKSMADSYGISIEEARQLKEEDGKILSAEEAANVFSPDEMQLDLSLRGGLGELIREIKRYMDYYHSQSGSLPVDKLLVSGGTANLEGFVSFMGEAMDLPVELGFVPVKVPGEFESEIPDRDPSFIISLGLALREAGLGAALYKMNLLPPELQKDVFIDVGRLKKALAISAAILVLLGGYGTFFWQYHARSVEIGQIQDEIEKLKPQVAKADLMAKELLANNKRSTEYENILRAQPRWSRVLGDINGNLPTDTFLTTIQGQYIEKEDLPAIGGFSSSPGYSSETRPPKKADEDKGAKPADQKKPENKKTDKKEPVSLPMPNVLTIEGITQSAASVGVLVNNMHNMPYFNMVKLRSVNEIKQDYIGQKKFIIDCYLKEAKASVE